jgi:uncharacterized membrane protein
MLSTEISEIAAGILYTFSRLYNLLSDTVIPETYLRITLFLRQGYLVAHGMAASITYTLVPQGRSKVVETNRLLQRPPPCSIVCLVILIITQVIKSYI